MLAETGPSRRTWPVYPSVPRRAKLTRLGSKTSDPMRADLKEGALLGPCRRQRLQQVV
jgi:hypothetical protein